MLLWWPERNVCSCPSTATCRVVPVKATSMLCATVLSNDVGRAVQAENPPLTVLSGRTETSPVLCSLTQYPELEPPLIPSLGAAARLRK